MKQFINLILAVFLVVGVQSCSPYKQVQMDSDVFLSHKIWQENNPKYVYLVHTDSSVLRMDAFKLDTNHLGQAETLNGELIPYSMDSVEGKKMIKTERRKQVHLYLTDEAKAQISEGDVVSLSRKDIKKVEMTTKKNRGVFGYILIGLGVILAIFIILVLLLFALLASSAGGSGGSSSNSDPQCYIATSVYGSSDTPEVLALRSFRDQVLMPNRFGRSFVRGYYHFGPRMVQFTQNKEKVNQLIRNVLNLFVRILS